MLPLVLIPGMMCDAALFAPQIAAMGARPVLVTPPTGADQMGALADQLLAIAPPRFALAGLSMGGILAMAVIARAPERVAALALLDCNPRAETEAVQATRGPQIAAAEAGRMAEVMERDMFPRYLHAEADPAILDTCRAMAARLGPAVFVRQSRALRDRPDQQQALRRVRVPSLILTGEDDRLCPMERHERMAALIPQARLTVIPRAGHLPTLENPAPTTAALLDWLKEAA